MTAARPRPNTSASSSWWRRSLWRSSEPVSAAPLPVPSKPRSPRSPGPADHAVRHRRSDENGGQVFPALLLVVVALFFLGLLFAQVGSAGDQAVQVQTAAD